MECSISSAQVKEIFQKLDTNLRQEIYLWAKNASENPKATSSSVAPSIMSSSNSNASTSSPFFFKCPKDNYGDPEKYQIKTLDSFRYASFTWPEIRFKAIPGCATLPELFKVAMELLRDYAIPFALLNCRYEFQNYVQVIGVDCPMDWLKIFVASQQRQNELEIDPKSDPKEVQREIQKLKEAWKSDRVEMDLYRTFSLAILKLRSEKSLPFVIFYSLIDKTFFICSFYNYTLLYDGFHVRIPGFKRDLGLFKNWPLVNHPSEIDPPEILCENPGCQKSGGTLKDFFCEKDQRKETTIILGMDDEEKRCVFSSYQNHVGPKERIKQEKAKAQCKDYWRNKLEPQAAAEIEEEFNKIILANQDEAPPEDLRETLTDAIVKKYEELMDQEEKRIEKEIFKEGHVILRKCAKCKQVAYCSTNCQAADWPRHKLWCQKLE